MKTLKEDGEASVASTSGDSAKADVRIGAPAKRKLPTDKKKKKRFSQFVNEKPQVGDYVVGKEKKP